MRRKRQQDPVNQHDVLEIVDHAFTVEKVHRRAEKIPVQRFREPQTSCPRRYVGDGDDLFEADDLHGRHDHDHVDVPGEHAAEEDADHYEGPDGAGDEGLFLLVVIAHGFLFLMDVSTPP